MNARELKLEANPEPENNADDSDRESQTRLITRRLPTAPWTRRATTFLEQALAESVMVDGGMCIIQEIDMSAEGVPEGSFELLEIGVEASGNVDGTRRARYAPLLRNIPSPKRRRTAANDTER